MFHPSSVSLFSAICQSDTNMLRQANTTIAVLNAWVFQSRALFLLTRYLSSRFHRTDRRPWENTTRKQSLFLYHLRLNHRDRLFSNSSGRSGVMHRIIFNTFGPKNSVLSILSPTVTNTISMFTTKATIQKTQIQKRQPRCSALNSRRRIQTKTAGPKKMVVRYQLELPSYLAR